VAIEWSTYHDNNNVDDEITISLIMIMTSNYTADDAGDYNNDDHE